MLNQEAAHFGCFHGPATSDTPSHPLTHSSFFCKHPIRLRPGDNICQMPPPSRFADREERLATEGREKYQGTARIKLEVLHFPQNEPRELDRKNVERLKGYFKKGTSCGWISGERLSSLNWGLETTSGLWHKVGRNW